MQTQLMSYMWRSLAFLLLLSTAAVGQINNPGSASITNAPFMPAAQYPNAGIAATALDNSANLVRVAKFVLPFNFTVGHFTIYINSATAASSANIAIYDLSGKLLVDSGSITTASTGQQGSSVTAVALSAGTYWLAWADTASTPTTNNISINGSTGFYINRVNTNVGSAANALSAGAMPATLGVITADGTTVNIPNVILEP